MSAGSVPAANAIPFFVKPNHAFHSTCSHPFHDLFAFLHSQFFPQTVPFNSNGISHDHNSCFLPHFHMALTLVCAKPGTHHKAILLIVFQLPLVSFSSYWFLWDQLRPRRQHLNGAFRSPRQHLNGAFRSPPLDSRFPISSFILQQQ